jgi:hypothetical protein
MRSWFADSCAHVPMTVQALGSGWMAARLQRAWTFRLCGMHGTLVSQYCKTLCIGAFCVMLCHAVAKLTGWVSIAVVLLT